ncbi:MAG: aminoacyl-tRNA deacylase [Gammaproteobacteria bacterium]
MPVAKLKDFLDQNQVKYVTIAHSRAFTAQEIAQSAHIPGSELAKAVMVRTDGRLAMAVLPASYQIDFDRLRKGAGASSVELASEKDFQDKFPGCELGAMPPFGNLYAMDVYVSRRLTEDPYIAFSAGSHTELIKLAYADYERLVRPMVIDF